MGPTIAPVFEFSPASSKLGGFTDAPGEVCGQGHTTNRKAYSETVCWFHVKKKRTGQYIIRALANQIVLDRNVFTAG
jgi:hypothetical protein